MILFLKKITCDQNLAFCLHLDARIVNWSWLSSQKQTCQSKALCAWFICSKLCTYFFKVKTVKSKHVNKQVHVINLLICYICTQFFKAKTVSSKHVKRRHYLPNLHGRNICTYFFKANNVTIKHVKTHHYVTYLFVCNVWNYFFNTKTVSSKQFHKTALFNKFTWLQHLYSFL